MKTIWKYEFVDGELNEMIPCGAEILDVQIQGGAICAWFFVDTSNDKYLRKLRIYMTGHELPMSHGKHVSTIQAHGMVYHVFDMGG